MLEWIFSASILILILGGVRRILKGKLNLCLQYAMWLLVLVRLLVPFQFGSSTFSAVSAMHAMAAQQSATVTAAVPQAAHSVSASQIAAAIWVAGIAVFTAVFTLSNLRFCRLLKHTRKRLEIPGAPIPVYVCSAVDTPCLFGTLKPAVYLTEAVASDPTICAHALAHELTHYRHRDHIWAVLRSAALILHWFNPLVWMAAKASRADAELACDNDTIHRIGEDQRAAYGRTLITMTCDRKPSLAVTATTMSGSPRSIRKRIMSIAAKPKMTAKTFTLTACICAVAVVFTFTGANVILPVLPEVVPSVQASVAAPNSTAVTPAPAKPGTGLSKVLTGSLSAAAIELPQVANITLSAPTETAEHYEETVSDEDIALFYQLPMLNNTAGGGMSHIFALFVRPDTPQTSTESEGASVVVAVPYGK